MEQEPINDWMEKTAENRHPVKSDEREIRVVQRRHKPVSQGNAIIALAEKLRPILTKMFEGVRDENGQLVQPARVRGVSLNLAQSLIKEYKAH